MYELTNLTSKSVLIPAVLIYLFRRLEKEFKTGEPTVLILDEVWAFLKLPIFAERLIKWIKVARSFNVAVGFATQNLSDIDDSDLSNIIKENCLTKIYLPNHEARNEGVVDYYRRFGLNEQQIHLIASSIRQRHYYYASQSGNRMFELNLKQVQWQFLARTSINDAHEARRIYKEDPEMFAYNWLKSAKVDESLRQNLDKWAEHWLEYKNANQAHANT